MLGLGLFEVQNGRFFSHAATVIRVAISCGGGFEILEQIFKVVLMVHPDVVIVVLGVSDA